MKPFLRGSRSGFTLVELMISLTLAALVIPMILSAYGSVSTSIMAAEKYKLMHNNARRAVDNLRKDLFEATNVVSCVTNLSLSVRTTDTILYSHSGTNLTRRVGGGTAIPIATGVHSILFSLYDEDRLPTTVPADAFFVEMTIWMRMQGVRTTYEDVLQTRVRLGRRL